MSPTTIRPTFLEGTPEEIAAVVRELPPSRYQVEIRGIAAKPSTNFLEDSLRLAALRSADEIEAARALILGKCRTPRAIPAGKTLEDVASGHWPGNETDDQIQEALENLS